MRADRIAVRLTGLAIGLIGILQFSAVKADQKLNVQVNTHGKDFKESLDQLRELSDDFQLGTISQQQLQHALAGTRLNYKRIEFLLEYYYPEYVEEHINGAPLLHIKRAGTRPHVQPPEGLQILDELVYSEEATEQKTEIAILARQLYNDYEALEQTFLTRAYERDEVVDAVRMQLVRITAMGITGFDTPGSLNALKEARISLESLKVAIAVYTEGEEPQVSGQISALFEGAISHLVEQREFDELDRLYFIKTFMDPLYGSLKALYQGKLDAISRESTWGWNRNSNSIFAPDFLDPYFFTEMERGEDNASLHALGQKLFYEPKLSKNGQMSCASCHKPSMGFTDGQPQSLSSVEGQRVLRNSPTLLNAVYSDRYFYDLRAFSLEQQAEHVIFNTEEFNTSYAEIVNKLNTDEDYIELFVEAFGKKQIDRKNFSRALASYVLSLNSFNSDFDRYMRGESLEVEARVKEGFNLFMGKAACGTCHFAPTFAGLVPPRYAKNESEILGLLDEPDSDELDKDAGRLASNMYSEMAWIYDRSFKTSTVRNVEITGPYFHNGTYESLDEVLDFYNHGGGAGLGLEVSNQTLSADSLGLSPGEKEALIAFMHSLTDNSAGQGYSE